MEIMAFASTLGPLALAAVVVLIYALLPARLLSVNTHIDQQTDQMFKLFPVAANVRIFGGARVGLDPAGYLKPFEPCDIFAGFAKQECNNTGGLAGAKSVLVQTLGDFQLTINGVALTDRGKPVFATADDAQAMTGHPDAYMGRIVHYLAANTALVRLRAWGEKAPNGFGSAEIVIGGAEVFEPTGAASTTKYHPSGLLAKSILGLGVLQYDAAGGGVRLEFDAVAEVALASLRGQYGTFEVAKGITLEALLVVADKGDNAALDIDIGLGTPLTVNSEADIDHADMVNLAAFHLDGNSDDIKFQSDDNVTDVAPVDTTIDNDSATDVPKRLRINVRPTGVVEAWIDGVRMLPATAFAVAAAARLAPFVNVEKTNDDTVAVVILNRFRAAGAAAA